jgi:plastocyanin
MRTHRYSLLGVVVVVVAAISGGCGGNGGSKSSAGSTAASTSSAPTAGGAVIKTVSVHETEYKLNPAAISLAKTGTYVFKGVNDGTITHGLAVVGNGVDAKLSSIAAGSNGTLKVTLSKSGTYEIYCPVDGHKGFGMKGTITVGGSGASGGTSTENMNTGTTEPTTTNSTGY